jgi:DNA-binding CsgD family transcriptional regulator
MGDNEYMSEAARRDDAFRSALERLPVAVIVVDGQRRLQPYNTRATELFECEALRGDLLATRPSHPLSMVVREILDGKSLDERTAVFPTGNKYRIAPSKQSPKGVGRWLMLLVSRVESESELVHIDAFDFTPRERDVAVLLVDGKTTEEICEALDIGRDTFKTHLRRLFDKTAARTRSEFVAKVLRSR